MPDVSKMVRSSHAYPIHFHHYEKFRKKYKTTDYKKVNKKKPRSQKLYESLLHLQITRCVTPKTLCTRHPVDTLQMTK